MVPNTHLPARQAPSITLITLVPQLPAKKRGGPESFIRHRVIAFKLKQLATLLNPTPRDHEQGKLGKLGHRDMTSSLSGCKYLSVGHNGTISPPRF